jgi:hypothetical protein
VIVSGQNGRERIRAQIEELRQRPRQGVPARERSSEASLHQRPRTVLDDNRALRDENRDLKHELALAYGDRRALVSLGSAEAAAATSPPSRGSSR